MKISARNILAGTVSKVIKGAVNAEVDLTLKGGEKVVAVITNGSIEHLGLKEGTTAYAIVKAGWVIVGKDLDVRKISARNVLQGTVTKVHEGAVNNEVELKLTSGAHLIATITKESSHSLGIKEGDVAYGIFKASSVIIAVD
jgi:molybdate transport system regulatory protein